MPKIKLSIKQLTDEFKHLQRRKFSKVGNVEARVLENLCHAQGEIGAFVRGGILKTDPASDNLVNLNLNLIGNRKRKLKGRLSAITPVFSATPDKTDPKSMDLAEVADKLIRASDRKVNQPQVTSAILEWLLVGGMCIEHIPWVENASVEPMPVRDGQGGFLFFDNENQQTVPQAMVAELIQMGRNPDSFELHQELKEIGDFVADIHGPLTVFVDDLVLDITKMAPNLSLNFAKIETIEFLRETYGDSAEAAGFDIDKLKPDEEMRIVKTSFSQLGDSRSGLNIKRLLPALQGRHGEGDPDMVLTVRQYRDKSDLNTEGREILFVPGQGKLLDQNLPYEDGIPAVQYNWEPPITTIFTRDWVHDLIPANLRWSKIQDQLAKYGNAFINAEKLLGGDLTEEQIAPTDQPRVVEKGLSPEGVPLVGFAQPPQIPGWFMKHAEMIKESFDEMAGGADLFRESRFPGQVRGSMGFPMLQEILDTEWGPFFLHFGEQMARAKQMRLNRMKQFYQGTRIMHFTDRNQRDESIEFKSSEILRAGVDFYVSVDVNSLIPELRSMREERIVSRKNNFPELYINERTGQFDTSKLAKDLRIGDRGREARAFQYRKLELQIIKRLRKGQPAPQIMPWWDLPAMLDEIEAEMSTFEFIDGTSQETQQNFFAHWQQMDQELQNQIQAQQDAAQTAQMDQIINQVAQQSASKGATAAVDLSLEQFIEGLRQRAAQGEDITQLLVGTEGTPQ